MTIGEERMMYAVTALPKRIEEATDQLKRIADALEKMSGDYIKIDWSKINGAGTGNGRIVFKKVVYDPVEGKVVSIEEDSQ